MKHLSVEVLKTYNTPKRQPHPGDTFQATASSSDTGEALGPSPLYAALHNGHIEAASSFWHLG